MSVEEFFLRLSLYLIRQHPEAHELLGGGGQLAEVELTLPHGALPHLGPGQRQLVHLLLQTDAAASDGIKQVRKLDITSCDPDLSMLLLSLLVQPLSMVSKYSGPASRCLGLVSPLLCRIWEFERLT